MGPGAAGGVLTLLYHLLLCICLSIPPAFLQAWLLLGMAGAGAISALLLLVTNVVYVRDADTEPRLF